MAVNKNQMWQLVTQQCRLRHLSSVSARNIKMSVEQYKLLTQTGGNLGYYFTLHADPDSPDFYTSEMLNGDVTDFNWKSFNWPSEVENVNLSLSKMHIKIFAATNNWMNNQEIIAQTFCFKDMRCLGEQIPRDGHHFRPNTIIFEMFSGYYVGSGSLVNINSIASSKLSTSRPKEIVVGPELLRNSYDFSTLKRVHTVQQAVRQTRASVIKVRTVIHNKLEETKETMEMLSEKEWLKNKLNILRSELKNQQQCLLRLQKNSADLEEQNQIQRITLAKQAAALKKQHSKLIEDRHNFIDTRENLVKTLAQLNMRRRHLISELSYIYPVHHIPDKGYSIGGVCLPDSESFIGKDDTMLSVALGYVAHLIIMVSQFLNIPLRYPILYMGTRSRIYDHMLSSISDSEREFPLFSRGTNKMQFNYGVYLLNKNIAQLRLICGLSTQDLRLTLFNTKALLELRPTTKLDQPSSAPMKIDKNPSALLKRIPHLNDDVSGSTDSLNADDAKHRTALWKSSPEHSRSGNLSLSLDHGLDEIVKEANFKRKNEPSCNDEHYNGGAIGIMPKELHLSEPSLADACSANGNADGSEDADSVNHIQKTWLPLQIYANESDGELPVHIIKDQQNTVPV
ncbi:hypothetical protein CHUAL_003793 [Chamberlinius hualienensis]